MAVLPIGFSIDVRPLRDRVQMIPIGEVDIATVPELQHRLGELLDAGFTRIVVDLRRVEFMDSSGLHALLDAHRQAQRDGWELSIIPGRRSVQHVFEITGIGELLPFTVAGDRGSDPRHGPRAWSDGTAA